MFVCLFVFELVLWNIKYYQTKLFKPQSFSNLKAPLQQVETSIGGTCLVEYQIFSNSDKKPKLVVSVLWIIWPLKGEKMFVSGVER